MNEAVGGALHSDHILVFLIICYADVSLRHITDDV